jgi:putative ABC transport system permease protein
MTALTRFIRRAAFWLRAGRHDADLAGELEYHRARTQAALEADGLPPAEAAARSRRAMGNVTLAREDARETWIFAAVERIWRDAVYGARALRREPAFAVTALLTLTLGIATTTTVFSVVDTELWKPLPFPQPAQLVAVSSQKPGTPGEYERVSAPDLLDWQAQSRLAEYAAEGTWGRRILRRHGAESVLVEAVTANYFRVLDHAPRIGRAFSAEQDGHGRAAIVTDRGWRRLFDADPGIVGSSLLLDGEDYTVVGILAGQHFEFGNEPDLYATFDPSAAAFRDRDGRQLSVIGRVRSGATVAQAEAELQAIAARIAEAYPDDHAGHRVGLRDLRLSSSAYNWRPLFFFLAAAVLVLILSCINVANLLLARALRRRREFAIRGALGGGRGSLVRQLVVEGALLAVPGAAAGALLSTWALQVFGTQIPEEYLIRGGHFTLNTRLALFVILISVVTTVLLSLAPMVFARRVELNLMLGQGGRTAGGSRRQVRARNGLLVAQLTVTLVLMAGAGVFVTSFLRLVRAPLGFDPHDRVSLKVPLIGPRYEGDAPVLAFAERLLERARATAGVQAAALDTSSPLDSGPTIRLVAADRPRPAAGDEPYAIVRAVTPDFFRTLAIDLRAGRAFAAEDVAGAPRVAIVNEYLAAQLFPGGNAVGQRIDLVPGARTPWARRPGIVQIVGVVPNVKDVGVNEVEYGNIYLPFAQMIPAARLELIVKAGIPAARLAGTLRSLVAEIDPDLPNAQIQTFEDRVENALAGDRFNAALIGVFAAVGILLAAVGIYGAMACAVQERTREFGVRLALGQAPGAIVRATLWQSARFGLAGGVMGLAILLVIARVLGNALYLVRGEHNGLLYGVTTTDPLSLGGAATVLVVIAVLSGILPARQATRTDPLIALRSE